ncbi:MAG: DUF4286 family protein [Bacteroidetes bacterium]|nr:DUF4286 family protein [Bacteroidota bacterium]MBU1483430.1 DUF4286 family protein [Bacteroidota bacterium]MBU1761138.1 DUF4286 family protein [Bacteroidota bacterium]MBU2046160.1 DUF4286 family protein [Bacteroidota bacterium]MBU2267325.1 DUF4286 family protein [Bacteroidota bacterium]
MIIYNVTTIIEESIHEEYLNFMHEIHMPEVMASGKFTSCQLLRLTEPINEGITYCAQYFTDSSTKLSDYRETYSPKLQEDFKERFENKYVSFRSVLESISPIQ